MPACATVCSGPRCATWLSCALCAQAAWLLAACAPGAVSEEALGALVLGGSRVIHTPAECGVVVREWPGGGKGGRHAEHKQLA